MSTKSLSTLDTEILLRWFAYRLEQEDRAALMQEFPGIYNRWMGGTFTVVMRPSDMPPVSKAGCLALAGECADDFTRELTRAREAIADKNPNEYAYRLIRANASLAQALIWARQAGDAAVESDLVRSMEKIMELTGRTRIAFE